MKTPAVSVLIAAFNYGRFLPECLDSILCQQSDASMEIIIVDDGSDDDTADIASRYPVRYFYQEHSGIASARNRCLAEARGDWVAFIDADDMWSPDKLALQLELARENPQCDIVFCAVKNLLCSEAVESKLANRPPVSENTVHYLTPALIKRELMLSLGGFSPRYDRGEDTDMPCRMRLKGIRLDICVQKPCYLRRLHGDNISLQSNDSMEQERRNIADMLRQSMLPTEKEDG